MSKTMHAPVGLPVRALGLMSGTSMDGIDVALIETDGEEMIEPGPSQSFPYPPEVRGRIAAAAADARHVTARGTRTSAMAQVEQEITELHAAAVSAFVRRHGLDREAIAVAGFHGQTVLHRPEAGLTVQLGDGPLLADLINIDVVHDLRAADVAAGGQGAPLVPVYHRALAARVEARPLAVVNVGGVANVTWIGRDGTLLAFDTGPGNALIDDWMARNGAGSFDAEGQTAARGRADEERVTFYLARHFFSLPPPKSLDRDAFPLDVVDGLSLEDGAATLTAVTARSIGKAREHMPQEPALWLVCGGGRHNKTLMSALAGVVENAVAPAEAAGFDGDATEAQAWAYLAVRSLKGMPITFPGTTGVAAPLTGGVLARRPSRVR